MKTKRMTALLLALSMALASCGGGGGAKAASMHLVRTEGGVAVADDAGKDVAVIDNLGLYGGYGVETQTESFAWINLDDTKLTKMDQESEIKIEKEGKALTIDVKSGALFFNVTRPLDNDETLDIRCSTMLVGIRGTCGWVTENTAALLEGTVEVTAGEQTVTITAGEMAYLTEDRELAVKSFYQEDTPAFVTEEPLEEEILNEVPSLYPLHVLTKHTISVYDTYARETFIDDFFYDEEGYIIRTESRTIFNMEELGPISVTNYSYDSERHCVVTNSDGSINERTYAPGTADITTVINASFADPMIMGWYDRRSMIGPDGRLELGSGSGVDGGNNFPDGSYAIYTMDADGYPINIDTYAPDGTLTGQCTLEWAVIG